MTNKLAPSPHESTSSFESKSSSTDSSSSDSSDFEDAPRPQRARKSTGAIDRGHPNAARRATIRGIFGGSSNNRESNRATYRGPRGLGVGKGSIRRLEIVRRREMEERARINARVRCANYDSQMPMAPFVRLVYHIFKKLYPNTSVKFQNAALICMRDISERYLINMFETANLFTVHAKRVTLFPKDIILYGTVKRFLNQPLGTYEL